MKLPGWIFVIAMLIAFVNPTQAQLPDDFPGITIVNNGGAAEGNVFLTVSTSVDGVGYYAFMIDNDGVVQGWKELDGDYAYDFKMQPNGLLSYAQFLSHHSYTGGGNVIHKVLDQDMNQIDSVQMLNRYIAEAHDFEILPNGHILMFGYYMTQMDLSDIVDGGYPDAQVSGGIIQELNADGEVIFQWRTWDHTTPEEYVWNPNRSARQTVSAFHLNTINQDIDGNLIFGTPQWNKKLDRRTGEILWTIGGADNEFSFVGIDSVTGAGHLGGHNLHRIPNGNFIIYDNAGRSGSNKNSEVHEYTLDEENKVATLVWTYPYTSDIKAWHRGNAQRLSNGNTLIGWGGASGDTVPTATEVDADKTIVWEAYFNNPEVESYRAFRFPMGNWKQAEAVETELALYNTYDFIQGDTLNTGVSVEVTAIEGFGYNELVVATYDQAPVYPTFDGYDPSLLAKRVTMDPAYMTFSGKAFLDVSVFNITNPDDITIWFRPIAGEGEFTALPTTYNFVTGKIVAEFELTTENQCELVFGYPDHEPTAYPPMLATPADGSSIYYQDVAILEWAPKGFFLYFDLQIATDDAFNNIVVDESNRFETWFDFDEMDKTTYYWRVKTYTDSEAGILESDWSEVHMFDASEAEIALVTPVGGERWQYGLEHFIEWESNFETDVIIQLLEQDSLTTIDTLHTVLDTTGNDGAYKWEIPVNLHIGCKYRIRISDLNDMVIAESPQYFSVTDTNGYDGCTSSVAELFVVSNELIYPVPTEDLINIEYNLSEQQYVSVLLYTIDGRKVQTVFEGVQQAGRQYLEANLNQLEDGIYILGIHTGRGEIHRKILVQ